MSLPWLKKQGFCFFFFSLKKKQSLLSMLFNLVSVCLFSSRKIIVAFHVIQHHPMKDAVRRHLSLLGRELGN